MTDRNSLVSIIIPAFNVESYIERCLKSVIEQSYCNLEVIVVDDGSKDKTSHIVEALAARDSRIRLITQVNQGVSQARNHGIEMAHGDYLLFLDSDDWLEPYALEALVDCVSKTNAEIIGLRAFFHRADGSVEAQAFPSQISLDELETFGPVLCGLPTFAWNYFISRSAIGFHRYRSDIAYSEDCLFLFQVTSGRHSYGFVEKPLYNYRVARPGSALESITKEGSRSIKHIKRLIFVKGKEVGYYHSAAVQYGAAAFGLLRRTANSKSEYYKNCCESKEDISILINTRSLRAVLYAFACKMPKTMRPIFVALGKIPGVMRIH